MKKRRIKRRIKAAASILVALAAGTFLACQRGVETAKQVLDASLGPAGDAGEADAERDRDSAEVAAAAPDALARYTGRTRDAAVDVNEHRKGMPVKDNLLE